MASYDFSLRKRQYHLEQLEDVCELVPTDQHPLQPKVAIATNGVSGAAVDNNNQKSAASAATTSVVYDPLSTELVDGPNDPLSLLASQAATAPKDPLSLAVAAASSTAPAAARVMDDSFEPWSYKKQGVLQKYTTNEKLSITSSFLNPNGGQAQVVKNISTMSEQLKNRLEQLDDFEEGSVQEMMDLSQADYVKRIDELNQQLITAWQNEQRVKALKIAIQCAKLLADTNVILFYPSKFVLITDILDTFGRLVYDRIKLKAAYFIQGSKIPKPLPDNFTPDMVPPSAKETCRNWFFKIASIRELVPRLLVEASILRCYSFLTNGEYQQALTRLTNMMRGIGDPLVGAYARCYLCRVGVKVAPTIKTHLMSNFNDFLATITQMGGTTVQDQLAVQRVEMPRYLNLYTPALDWILQCIAYKAPEKTLEAILEECRSKTTASNALLINSIMSAFPPEYIASRALEFTELIKNASDSGLPKHHLFRTLGMNVTLSSPPKDQQLKILNEVWKEVVNLTVASDYISCAEVWIEYPAKHFGSREINAMLGDVIKHMTPDREYENFFPQLQSVLGKILSHVHDFAMLFSMDKFMPFLDLFQNDKIRVDVCKGVMNAFVANQKETTADPVILSGMMYIGRILHDSVTAMTFDDEVRQISALVVGFLSKVAFGRDFEQMLNFFTQARSSFSNLDTVLQFLVHNVNALTMRTREIVKGNHTRKTAAFTRSCIAYNFITIPSISGVYERLQLYVSSGRVAIVNQALTQADAFFTAAIDLIAEMPASIEVNKQMVDTEVMLVDLLCTFLGSLLVLPDHPDHEAVHILRLVLNATAEYDWEEKGDAKFNVYLSAVSLLAAMAQPKFLSRVPGVDSNDALYGGSPKFVAVINEILDSILKEMLDVLKTVQSDPPRQAKMALDLFDRIVMIAETEVSKTAALAMNLWNLAKKTGAATQQQARSKALVQEMFVRDQCSESFCRKIV